MDDKTPPKGFSSHPPQMALDMPPTLEGVHAIVLETAARVAVLYDAHVKDHDRREAMRSATNALLAASAEVTKTSGQLVQDVSPLSRAQRFSAVMLGGAVAGVVTHFVVDILSNSPATERLISIPIVGVCWVGLTYASRFIWRA